MLYNDSRFFPIQRNWILSILSSAEISMTMGEVDSAFIQPPERRPKLSTTEAEGIPSIDLSALSLVSKEDDSYPSVIEGLANEIGNACKYWGFFQIINHGVPLQLRQRLEAAATQFFAQTSEEKRKLRRDIINVYGYFDAEYTKNVRDWKEIFEFTVNEPTLVPASHEPDDDKVTQWNNQWPEYPPEFREVCKEYAQEMVQLAQKLMGLIALSLGLPEDRFNEFFKDQTSFIKINHYPPHPSPHMVLGVGQHKDAGALTVLAQDDVGGLEVKRKSDGEWVGVKPIPDGYIINIGDIIKVWTNDAYDSAEHRVVVNSEKKRLSIPFFFNPSHYTMVKPLKELIDEQNPAKYRPYNWGKFVVARKRSNFMKLNVDNIEISQFKVTDELVN